MPSVVVIGAGLSGLAAAFRIQQRLPQAEITILEANSRPGGNIWTEQREGFAVEIGPNGIFDAKPHTLEFCSEIDVREPLLEASEASRKNRYLFLDNELHKLPASPLALLGIPFLSPLAKLRLLAEPFQRRKRSVPDDESIASFASRRFGPEVANTIIDALVTGIHGGDPEQLSLKAAFPRLAAFEKNWGSVIRGVWNSRSSNTPGKRSEGLESLPKPQPAATKRGPRRMWSYRSGLKTMIEAAAEKFSSRLVLGVKVRSLNRCDDRWQVIGDEKQAWHADAVVLTSPTFAQAECLADVDAELSELMSRIPYTPIAVVALGYRREAAPKPLEGFGYISPQRNRRDVLGVQWCSSIYPGRAPEGCVLWRALCGGVNRPDIIHWDDETLLRRVHHEMKLTMGVTSLPIFEQIVRWPHAIPQYRIGHLERVSRIMQIAARYPGLFLGGNGYHGIAMNDCTEQAVILAELVADDLIRRTATTRR